MSRDAVGAECDEYGVELQRLARRLRSLPDVSPSQRGPVVDLIEHLAWSWGEHDDDAAATFTARLDEMAPSVLADVLRAVSHDAETRGSIVGDEPPTAAWARRVVSVRRALP